MGCEKLEYLNLINAEISENPKHLVIQNILSNTTKNLVICINPNQREEISKNLDITEQNCITFDCSENWRVNRKKIFVSNGSCINECKFAYGIYCYDECPNGTFYDGYICENYSFPYKILETTNLAIEYNMTYSSNNSICDVKAFFLGKCKNNFQNLEDKETFKNNILSAIKDGTLTGLISSRVKNGSYMMNDDDNKIYLISTLANQINMENITSINFSECEKLLREKYESDEELYTFRIDHNIEGYKIPIIEYVIFNENGTFLNLDKCNNIHSQYFIPVSINEDDLFKHDPSSDYYNDECSIYKSENGKDMTMYDRKNDYNENHLSLCEANCSFKGYNSSTSKAECECKTKSYLYTKDDLSNDDLLNKMDNEQKPTNLNLMKCNNLISSSENIKNNTGFFLLAIIIILFIIVMIIFCVKGYNTLENKINEVIYNKFKPGKVSNKPKSNSLFVQLNSKKNQTKGILGKNNHKVNNSNKLSLDNKKTKNNLINNKIKKGIKHIKNLKNTKNNMKTSTIIGKVDKEDIKNFLKCTNDYELNLKSFTLCNGFKI